MRLHVFVLSFLLLSGCLFAHAANAPWVSVRTEHFTVLTDAGDRQARHTAGQLERMQAVFARLLPNATDDPGSRIVVLALRDRKEFQSVEPAAYLSKNALDLAGLFMHGDDKNYILLRLDGAGDHPFATVYHEYTHYMMRHAQYLPVWLNEGLAQFYQNTDINEHEVRLGQPDAGQILFLREKQLIPLPALFAVDATSPYYREEDKGSVFYAESWALTHLLFMADFGKPEGRLRQYTQHLMRGENPVTAATAVFGDLRQLQKVLEAYINSGDYRALGMPLQNVVSEKDLSVQPLASTDADAIRADVLARNGREAEAKALDEAVLAVAPSSAQAHESMGLIELRHGDQRAASRWFREAVQLHSDDFLSYYYAGALSQREGADGATAAGAALRESLRLNPHFAPALVSLSQVEASEGKLDEALADSLRAVEMDPRNLDFRLNAAEIRVARREIASAISGLETTLKLVRTPGERGSVETRLEELRSYEGQATARNTLPKDETLAIPARNGRAQAAAAVAAATELHGDALRPVVLDAPERGYPQGSTAAPKHEVRGTVQAVSCFVPKGLLLTVVDGAKSVPLFSNDMYSVSYSSGNFTPDHDLDPCREFNGLKAVVTYRIVDDPRVKGEILSMELNR